MTHIRIALLAFAVALSAPVAVMAQGTTKTATAKAAPETQAQLQKEATIKLADASVTALKEVPGGTTSKQVLARKKGKVVYVFTINVKGKPGSEKVDVDATTGEMVSHTHKAPAAAKTPPADL